MAKRAKDKKPLTVAASSLKSPHMQPANEPKKRKNGSERKVSHRRDDAKFVNQEEYIRNLSDQVGKACGAWLRKRGVPDGNWRDIAGMKEAVAKGMERGGK